MIPSSGDDMSCDVNMLRLIFLSFQPIQPQTHCLNSYFCFLLPWGFFLGPIINYTCLSYLRSGMMNGVVNPVPPEMTLSVMPKRKRKRRQISCTECRKRKQKVCYSLDPSI